MKRERGRKAEFCFVVFALWRYRSWPLGRGPVRRKARVRQTLGVVLLLLLAPAARAAAPRIVVLEGLDLPGHMSEFHARTREALEAVARAQGREVVPPEGARWCSTAECFRAAARAAGAREVVTIRGGRNESEGYQLELELRHSDGEPLARQAGSCDVCSGPEMVALAEKLGRVLLSAPPPQEPLAPAPVLVTTPAAPTLGVPETGRGGALWLGVGTGAAGLVVSGVGAYLWHMNGGDADCRSNEVGGNICLSRYNTARLGIPLVVTGAVGVALGSVLVIHAFRMRHTGVAVGPSSLALVGRF